MKIKQLFMKENKPKNRFYVYALLDPRKPGKYKYGKYKFDFEPFYVGKGHGNRCDKHICEALYILSTKLKITKKNFPNVNIHKIRKILKIIRVTGEQPIVVKIKNKLKETNAFKLEKKIHSNHW
jgi:hypothetical protein